MFLQTFASDRVATMMIQSQQESHLWRSTASVAYYLFPFIDFHLYKVRYRYNLNQVLNLSDTRHKRLIHFKQLFRKGSFQRSLLISSNEYRLETRSQICWHSQLNGLVAFGGEHVRRFPQQFLAVAAKMKRTWLNFRQSRERKRRGADCFSRVLHFGDFCRINLFARTISRCCFSAVSTRL